MIKKKKKHTHGYTANIPNVLTETFPLVDLRHFPFHPLSPIRSNYMQTYGTMLSPVMLAKMEITII